MRPSLGRIVIVRGPKVTGNGTDKSPAIVTKVWSNPDSGTEFAPAVVSVRAFPDQAPSINLSSINLYEDEDAAEGVHQDNDVAFWPPRA